MKTLDELVAEFKSIPTRFRLVPEIDELYANVENTFREAFSQAIRNMTGKGWTLTSAYPEDMVESEKYAFNVALGTVTCLLALKDGETIISAEYQFDDLFAFHRGVGQKAARDMAMTKLCAFREELRRIYTPQELPAQEKTDG